MPPCPWRSCVTFSTARRGRATTLTHPFVRPIALAALAAALAAPAAQATTVVTYDFSLKATTPNDDVPSLYQPFGFSTATPTDTFHAILSYEVQGTSGKLLDFALTIGNQSWTESPQQQVLSTLNPDGTLLSLIFRADSDGNASQPWEDIFEIVISTNNPSFWRAFEGNCQVPPGAVKLSCIQGVQADGGLSFQVTRQELPEPAPLALATVAFAGLAAARRRRQ